MLAGAEVGDTALHALSLPVDVVEGVAYLGLGAVETAGLAIIGGAATFAVATGETLENAVDLLDYGFSNAYIGGKELVNDLGRLLVPDEELGPDIPPQYERLELRGYPTTREVASEFMEMGEDIVRRAVD